MKSAKCAQRFCLTIGVHPKIWVQLASNTSSEEFFITPKVAASPLKVNPLPLARTEEVAVEFIQGDHWIIQFNKVWAQ
jgi:hypothetical protein